MIKLESITINLKIGLFDFFKKKLILAPSKNVTYEKFGTEEIKK